MRTCHSDCANLIVVQNEGNVCLGILDGSEVHDGSINIIGGMLNFTQNPTESTCFYLSQKKKKEKNNFEKKYTSFLLDPKKQVIVLFGSHLFILFQCSSC